MKIDNMIHIILDTNIYRANPARDSVDFLALSKLAKANELKLYLPYIVEREFQTQQREIYSKDFEKILSGLNGLSRKQLSNIFSSRIVDLEKEMKSIKSDLLSDAESQILVWSNSVNAERIPICLDQVNKAWEAYFTGTAPLKEPKIRDDIPDSFLIQAIIKIIQEHGTTHIVANDNKIKESFSENQNAVVHTSLAAFFESEEIQEKLKYIDLIEQIEKIKHGIAEFEKDTGEIGLKVSLDLGEEISGEVIHDKSIRDDNHEATIISYGEVENLDLKFDAISYYGDGNFSIPFLAKLTVDAIYYIFKSDYFSDYEYDEGPSISDHNDHYFEAEEEFEIEVKGIASIKIQLKSIDFEEFSENVEFDSIKIDSVESISIAI